MTLLRHTLAIRVKHQLIALRLLRLIRQFRFTGTTSSLSEIVKGQRTQAQTGGADATGVDGRLGVLGEAVPFVGDGLVGVLELLGLLVDVFNGSGVAAEMRVRL